ncbi:hypothetical protein [Micromonospora orduensis]|uniref:hypothetical protein n=1 Tax=Micromonospora orduensis TaxID=1420891 RepID=UPI00142F03CF|nr:hypothetical protein [Micromonospora orduensis]
MEQPFGLAKERWPLNRHLLGQYDEASAGLVADESAGGAALVVVELLCVGYDGVDHVQQGWGDGSAVSGSRDEVWVWLVKRGPRVGGERGAGDSDDGATGRHGSSYEAEQSVAVPG